MTRSSSGSGIASPASPSAGGARSHRPASLRQSLLGRARHRRSRVGRRSPRRCASSRLPRGSLRSDRSASDASTRRDGRRVRARAAPAAPPGAAPPGGRDRARRRSGDRRRQRPSARAGTRAPRLRRRRPRQAPRRRRRGWRAQASSARGSPIASSVRNAAVRAAGGALEPTSATSRSTARDPRP